MQVKIPDELKKDVPQTSWGKILNATPVVMAVVATMLAGLASSEMTRAQYDRALAAQQQSKAGDQWSFFQAKRLRGAYQQNTADLLAAITEIHDLDLTKLQTAAEQLPRQAREDGTGAGASGGSAEAAKVSEEMLTLLRSAPGTQTVTFLVKGQLPARPAASADPEIKKVLDAVEAGQSDAEVARLLSALGRPRLDEAARAAREQAQAFDAATRPINEAIDRLQSLLARRAACLAKPGATVADTPGAEGSLNRDFTAARLRYAAQRYEVEARLNQALANVYELEVRLSNLIAERHHARSQRFFLGMLGAQLAVIISTFAIAARQRNLLWSLAAAAGLLAIAFAVYVYLKV